MTSTIVQQTVLIDDIKPLPENKKERVHYSEMPFWKANPHLKPRDPKPFALKKDFFDAFKVAQEAFKDISDEEWDDVIEQLKNDR